jgi:hypothetical protein
MTRRMNDKEFQKKHIRAKENSKLLLVLVLIIVFMGFVFSLVILALSRATINPSIFHDLTNIALSILTLISGIWIGSNWHKRDKK